MKTAYLAAILTVSALVAADAPAPQFTADNQLIRPEGYREWIYLSSGLGMSYSGKGYDESPDFTNVFIKPEAYREFVKTGTFPDGTVLVLELRHSETNGSINKGGRFQTRLVGIEASIKDSKRFPEKWAYFSFVGDGRTPLAQAKACPKDNCWKCHNEHADTDNVFTQFYPALIEAREKAK